MSEIDRRSYCERQIQAPLIACKQCKRSFYMVKPRDLCAECRGFFVKLAWQPAKEPLVDVSGNLMTGP